MTEIVKAIEEIINNFLVKKLGADYGSIRSLIDAGDNKVIQRVASHINDQIMTPYTKRFNDIETELTRLENNYEEKIVQLKREIDELKNNKPTDYYQTAKPEQNIQQVRQAESNSTIIKFNDWAANPSLPLPHGFSYVSDDFRIRTKQPVNQTTEEKNWLINTGDGQKYLLPNPMLFTQMTIISELYAMDQTRLQEKGKNRIKVIEPCKISGDGFIEFCGKLELLP
jgi:hypothetical protein